MTVPQVHVNMAVHVLMETTHTLVSVSRDLKETIASITSMIVMETLVRMEESVGMVSTNILVTALKASLGRIVR